MSARPARWQVHGEEVESGAQGTFAVLNKARFQNLLGRNFVRRLSKRLGFSSARVGPGHLLLF